MFFYVCKYNSTTEDSRWLVQTFQVVATANFLNTTLDIVSGKGGIMKNNRKIIENISS